MSEWDSAREWDSSVSGGPGRWLWLVAMRVALQPRRGRRSWQWKQGKEGRGSRGEVEHLDEGASRCWWGMGVLGRLGREIPLQPDFFACTPLTPLPPPTPSARFASPAGPCVTARDQVPARASTCLPRHAGYGSRKDRHRDTPHQASQLAWSTQCKVFGIRDPSRGAIRWPTGPRATGVGFLGLAPTGDRSSLGQGSRDASTWLIFGSETGLASSCWRPAKWLLSGQGVPSCGGRWAAGRKSRTARKLESGCWSWNSRDHPGCTWLCVSLSWELTVSRALQLTYHLLASRGWGPGSWEMEASVGSGWATCLLAHRCRMMVQVSHRRVPTDRGPSIFTHPSLLVLHRTRLWPTPGLQTGQESGFLPALRSPWRRGPVSCPLPREPPSPSLT